MLPNCEAKSSSSASGTSEPKSSPSSTSLGFPVLDKGASMEIVGSFLSSFLIKFNKSLYKFSSN